jgi:hypothetical protein
MMERKFYSYVEKHNRMQKNMVFESLLTYLMLFFALLGETEV